MKQLRIYTDGSCNNLKPEQGMGTGVTIENSQGVKLFECSSLVQAVYGKTTSNIAEFYALHQALQEVLNNYLVPSEIVLYTDSQLLYEALTRKATLQEPTLMTLLENIDYCIDRITATGGSVNALWIPREENKACDALSKLLRHANIQH